MNSDEVMTEIADFLDEVEDEGSIDFRIDSNYNSITVISLADD